MATGTVRAQVGHDDLIHDAQLDYYGLRLATCSSDRLVKIFDVVSQNGAAPKVEFSCDLVGHTGPVWEVAWAHPRWGTLLASCSYDGSVIVHRQSETGAWEDAFKFTAKGSVNSIEWCPFEYGLALACASSDGHVYVLRCDATTGEWTCEISFSADKIGCNSVTWAPYGALGSLTPDGRWVLRLAAGGGEQKVKIYKCEMDPQAGPQWFVDQPEVLDHHRDWIRDVAWAPSIGLPYNLLASCSEDGSVCIWSQESEENSRWEKKELPNFKAPVWRVAWSVTGSLLAVSAGDADVTLWKESLEEKKWIKVSEVKDKASASIPATTPSQQPTSQPSHQQPSSQKEQPSQQQPKARTEPLEKQAATSSAPSPRSTAVPPPTEVSAPTTAQQASAPAQTTIEASSEQPASDTQPQTTWEGVPESSGTETSHVNGGEWTHEQQPAQAQDNAAAPVSAGPEYADHGAQYGEYTETQQQQYAYDPAQQAQWGYQGGEYGDQQQYAETGQYDQQYAEGGEGQYGGWDQQQQGQEGWGADQLQWGQQQQWEGQQASGSDWTHQHEGQGWAAQGSEYPGSSQGLAAPPVYAGATQPGAGNPQQLYGGQQQHQPY